MYRKKGKPSPEAKAKQQFRQSAKWKKWRAYLKKLCNATDWITQKKLYKGFQVHHKDMRLENYKKTDKPERFLCCNKKTHDVIHWLYDYYQTDPAIIDRLKTVLEEMKIYNND